MENLKEGITVKELKQEVTPVPSRLFDALPRAPGSKCDAGHDASDGTS